MSSQVGATYAPIVQTESSVSLGNVTVSLCELSLPQILSAVPVSVFVGLFVIFQAPQACPVAGIVSVTVPYTDETYSCEPVFSQVGATYAPFVQTELSVSFGRVAVSLCELSLPQILSAVPLSVCVGFFVIFQAPQACPVAEIVSVTVPYTDEIYSCEPVPSQVGATYAPIVQTESSVSFGNVTLSLCLLSLPQTLSAVPVSVFVGLFVIFQAPQACPVAEIVSTTFP